MLITARNSQSALKRGADLGIDTQIAVGDKLASVQALCAQHGVGLEQVAFMGDDLPDLAPLGAVGLAVAPANAHPWIAERVHWQTAPTADVAPPANCATSCWPHRATWMRCWRGSAHEPADTELAHPSGRRPAAGAAQQLGALRNRDRARPTTARSRVWTTFCTTSRSWPWMSTARSRPPCVPRLERQRGDQTINIATPLFEMPDKDGKHWTLRAETGWLSAKGDQMKLRGNVAGDSPADPGVVPTTFRTDHLDVFPKENRARTDALVTMTRPGMEQSGVGFEVIRRTTRIISSASQGPLHAQTLIPPPARDVSGQAQGRQPTLRPRPAREAPP